MNPMRWLSGLFGALAVFAGAAWWLQTQETEVLRGELAMLREERGELRRLTEQNRRLSAAQVPAAELERLRADHAAIGRLRAEIERLRATTEATAKRVDAAKRGR